MKISLKFTSFFFKFCLSLLLFASAVFGQGADSSVLIYDRTKPGSGEANAVSNYLSDQIGKGLLNQYPCVDWIDEQGLAAILDLERQRQLLGQEADDELLTEVAGAIGSRYLIVVRADTLPNGQTSVSAIVLDTQTGRAVARRQEQSAGGDAALDSAELVAKNLMQDLAGIFKNRCEPHWTGTITYSFKVEKSDTKTGGAVPGPMERNVRQTVFYSEKMEEKVEIFLQPNSLGSTGNKTMARVTHSFDLNYLRTAERSSIIRCRPPNAQSYEKPTSGSSRETVTESGAGTETFPVYINVDKITGRYDITVDYPALSAKRREESSGVRSGCEEQPFAESKSGAGDPMYEAFQAGGFLKIYGQTDPRNPDVLTGRETTGDIENGLYTKTWNLRYVDPKAKK